MEDLEKLQPPTQNVDDIKHSIARAALSAIPFVGGPSVEILNLLLPPSLEKRRQIFLKDVSDELDELRKKPEFNIDRLNDDEFLSVFIQATWIAVRNHQKEKLDALRNAVVNSAIKIQIEADMQLIFLRFIDELTPSHLHFLKFLYQRSSSKGNRPGQIWADYCKYSGSRINYEFVNLLLEDLKIRSLVYHQPEDKAQEESTSRDPGQIHFAADGYIFHKTEIGASFLKFISLGENE